MPIAPPPFSRPPVLAVDITAITQNAVLRLSSPESEAFFSFQLPSPALILTERIRACTAAGQSLYLRQTPADKAIFTALQAHREAGLPLSLSPDAAACLGFDPATLESMGITIAPKKPTESFPPPTGAVSSITDAPLKAAGETSLPADTLPTVTGTLSLTTEDLLPSFWHNLLEASGLPRPERILACATEYGRPLGGTTPRPLVSALEALFAKHGGGIPLPELAKANIRPEMLRLSSIQRMTGFSALDSAFAFVLGVLALPVAAGRSQREGVVALHADNEFLRAALIYRGCLFALLELPARALTGKDNTKNHPDREELGAWLDDLRLGWLPPEKATAKGGFLCRAEALPAEAEGFRPLFITGPNAFLLEGFGQQTDSDIETAKRNNCRGLLRAYDYSQELS